MGRKSPKKYSKMSYFEKQAFTKDQAKKHGIDLKYETVNGRHEQVDWEASNKAVSKAMANDYDTRRSIEAAQLSGNKKAQKLGKGISNINDAVNAERFMAKTHANRIGATGKYSSANDEGNVTNYWVNKDRNKLMDSMSANDQAAAPKEQSNPKPEDLEPFDFEYSDKVQGAKDRIDKYELGVRSGESIFNQDNNQPVAGDDQAAAADAFVDIYKADLLDASNLKENKAHNLNNAMDTVASYRSKFMR